MSILDQVPIPSDEPSEQQMGYTKSKRIPVPCLNFPCGVKITGIEVLSGDCSQYMTKIVTTTRTQDGKIERKSHYGLSDPSTAVPMPYYGFRLLTSNPNFNITTQIDNEKNCTEHFGGTIRVSDTNAIDPSLLNNGTSEDFNKFNGATIVVEPTIEILETKKGDYSIVILVTVLTDKGTIFMSLYNEHNGYYKHWYKVSLCKNHEHNGLI
jgi:hypothetical protein